MISYKHPYYTGRAYSRNLGHSAILTRNLTFLKKKGAQKFTLPLLNPFSFCKKGQYLIVKYNIGLDYALTRMNTTVIWSVATSFNIP